MTTPAERTKAVRETRELLHVLTEPDTVDVPGLIQTVARNLLRHYPADVDLDASAVALPLVWGTARPIRLRVRRDRRANRYAPRW
ncbi:BPSL0761 family protein [Paraburkholderia sp. RL17-373-BIF-A]|uniref:BPSL0761 family protein n=1 Tax=Paraburkholderia sp. RL17-373-BIF-A TaxID=3031629 RepID=UPI0038BE0957